MVRGVGRGPRRRGIATQITLSTTRWRRLGDPVSKIDPATGAEIDAYPVGNAPIRVAFDGTHVWVTNRNDDTVSKIDPATGTIIETYPVGDAPVGLVFDGTNIWVTNQTSDTLSKIIPG